ncbi:MAG: EAL domain-containing protein [Pseudomonadota bacterium]
MQQTARFSRVHGRPAPAVSLRLQPVVHLQTGTLMGQVTETDRAFGDWVRFGPAADPEPAENAVERVVSQIETAAALAQTQDNGARPLFVSLPMAALVAPLLAEACADAAGRAKLCPQEICLMVDDSALLYRSRDMFIVIRDLRAVGLRVGIDARRTWDAPLTDGLRLLLDTVVVRVTDLDRSKALEESVVAADGAGMSVIVEGAHWRDADWLADMGIRLALRPRLDS